MTATFPSLPGLDIAVKRTGPIYSTGVQSGATGKEQRASWWSSPKFSYELTFNFLRQANFSAQTLFDEVLALKTFFDSMAGQFGTFNFLDPVDGVVRTCRFQQDQLDLEQIVYLVWKSGSIRLLSVK
jgi:hypothetical protein